MSGCFEARLRAEGRLRPPHAAQRPSRIVTGAPSKLGMAFLTRIAPTRNLNRFYVVRVMPTLFGEWAVARGWGRRVLSALAPGGGYQSSWGTLLLVLGGMNRDAVPGMSINGHQASV